MMKRPKSPPYHPGQKTRPKKIRARSLGPLRESNFGSHYFYQRALSLMRSNYFWEAHEYLELVWRVSNLEPRQFLQALIQICAYQVKKKQDLLQAKGRLRNSIRIRLEKFCLRDKKSYLGVTSKEINNWIE